MSSVFRFLYRKIFGFSVLVSTAIFGVSLFVFFDIQFSVLSNKKNGFSVFVIHLSISFHLGQSVLRHVDRREKAANSIERETNFDVEPSEAEELCLISKSNLHYNS